MSFLELQSGQRTQMYGQSWSAFKIKKEPFYYLICNSRHVSVLLSSYSYLFFLKIAVSIQSTDSLSAEQLTSFYLSCRYQHALWSQSPRKCHRLNWSILLDQMHWSRTTASVCIQADILSLILGKLVLMQAISLTPDLCDHRSGSYIRHLGLCIFSIYLQSVKVQPLQTIYA